MRAPRASNKSTALLCDTELFDVRATLPDPESARVHEGLRLFSLPAALIACPPGYFDQHATDARAALAMIRDASEVLDPLLAGGNSRIAGRLAGAFRNIGRARIAADILAAMRAAGYDVREADPLANVQALPIATRGISPHAARMRLMWAAMRSRILGNFPVAPGLPQHPEGYLKAVEDTYVSDAYHSLSIEGYQVSPMLIARVRSGDWNPDVETADRSQRDALAARGYFQAYRAVRDSVSRVLRGDPPGVVADEEHSTWYRKLFAPSVQAGLIQARDLAGYRNAPVYIRGSKHVPPSPEAVRDALPTIFELLTEELDPAVRVVLGHFVVVYVHPYLDGNGRIGRFLMNVMLAAGGYPWTVIPLPQRDRYMQALEAASVDEDIAPLTEFLAQLVAAGIAGNAIAPLPTT